MSIRAVLFDLDNTLTHRDQSIAAYSQYFADYYQENLRHVELTHIQQIIRYIDNGGYPQKERLTHRSIGASVAYALQQKLAWHSTPDLDDLSAFWFREFGSFAVAMTDAEAVLRQLKKQNYILGIISNGGHQTRLNIVHGLGFDSYFDVIHSSESVGVSKPNAEIFLHTARTLNLLPEQCLFVGDHPVNDIQGAKNAGMQALLLEGFHEKSNDSQVQCIQYLTQIFHYLVE